MNNPLHSNETYTGYDVAAMRCYDEERMWLRLVICHGLLAPMMLRRSL